MPTLIYQYLFHRVIKGWGHRESSQIARNAVRAYRRQRIERFGRI
jgi:hypothetical protein